MQHGRAWLLGVAAVVLASHYAPPLAHAAAPAAAKPRTPMPLRGDVGPGLDALDRVVPDVLRKFRIPGGTLAVVKAGRLVLARGYGFADRENGIPAEPSTAFALASLSKSITAVAVLRLVDERRLDLEDRVVDRLSATMQRSGVRLADPRVGWITVRQLLDHSSGFPREPSSAGCPRAAKVAPEPAPMIACMFGKPLSFAPGTRSQYSNFGYTVLGEIVRERAGASTYAAAARALVLSPMGLDGVRIEEAAPGHLPGQAIGYSGKGLPARVPGGGSLRRAASGGWVASVLDMTRFLGRLGDTLGAAVLTPPTLAAMLARPAPILVRPDGSWFGLGWDVVRSGADGFSFAKNGGLRGVSTHLAHVAPDVDLAVFLNAGDGGRPESASPRGAGVEGLRAALAQTTQWPDVDYGSRYTTP